MLRLFRKILGSWKQVDTRTSGLRQRLECCQSPDTSGPPFSCGRTVTCDAHREVHKSRASPKSPQSTQLRHWLWCRSAWRASAAPSGYTEAGIWRRRRVANPPIRGSAYRHLLTTSLGRRRSFTMWACIHPSFRTVWRKQLKKRKILDA